MKGAPSFIREEGNGFVSGQELPQVLYITYLF